MRTIMDPRREVRRARTFRVLLSYGQKRSLTEPGSTENVSPHGLRVRTKRFWEPGTTLIVQSFGNEFSARARIAYCQMLPAKTFAIGLEILARTDGWITR